MSAPLSSSANPRTSQPAWQHNKLLAVVFVLLAAYIMLSPGIRQVLGVHNRYTREWSMFAKSSHGFVVARFMTKDAEGELREIDRYALLGYKTKAKAPKWIKTIQKKRGLSRVIKSLCGRLHAKGGLYVDAKISHRSKGWVVIHDGKENLCE